MERVEIFDTTLRDGEQATQGFKHGKDSKLEMAKKLAEMGVDTIEAGYPNSSPEDYESVETIANDVQGPWICGLARAVPQDIEPTWGAISHNPKPTLHVFTYMVNKDALDSYGKSPLKIIDESVKGVSLARELVGDNGRVEFSAQNLIFAVLEALKGRDKDSLKFLIDLYGSAISAGADVLNLPDTEGRVMPYQMEIAVAFMKDNIPGMSDKIISVHGHNDLGMSVANSLAAIRGGARQIECTVNGIGERAGNTALEEVVMGIWTHGNELGVYTDVNAQQLNEISRMVSYHTGWDIQSNKAIVGANALRHSSGIHQDGNIKGNSKGKKVYEIFNADTVGWTGESNQLTARSGKRGVHARLERLGYDIGVETVESKVMPVYIGIADERKLLTDIDLRVIMDIVCPPTQRIKYEGHSINNMGWSSHYLASVKLDIDGEVQSSAELESKRMQTQMGSTGAIDALFTSVDSLIEPLFGKVPTLVDYDIRPIGKRHSTEGEATIVLSDNGHDAGWARNLSIDKPVYIGRARHLDTMKASVMAYINAINNYVNSIKE